jgi:hypothetical protein
MSALQKPKLKLGLERLEGGLGSDLSLQSLSEIAGYNRGHSPKFLDETRGSILEAFTC